MSGLNEIIQWTADEIDFTDGEDPQKAFDFIDREFTKENRLPLADILGDQLPKYMEFIEERTFTTREDLELSELEQRVNDLEQEIRGFFNILGTPIR